MKKSLKETLAPMDNSEKIQYIWHYYKYFIIGAIALVLFITYAISSVANKKEDVLNIVMMADSVNPDEVDKLKETLSEELLTKEVREKSNIRIQTMQTSSDQMDMQAGVEFQKMAAELSAGYIDIFVVDKEFFENMNEGQLLSFQKLSGMKDLPFQEDHVYHSKANEKEITGVNISEIPLLVNVIQGQDKVLCMPANAKNTEYISRFLNFIMKSE
ncbi:hypothetical protein [Lederbergia citrea]|uniref:Uncharacterized protein n=1 Tax=Lederbergia citrea TaxID=2833581 RepID=A0A942Z455_9BACI|nr:hypothetical protein [Lederbergia citrea]MBS4177337.1 hypothetical protein [Lederbergia citrea]MBS4204000.1 hypothetical protein [Lederbergia citrea]MBS4221416.1 hypothetical protein [Lederbergia citrea]